MAYVYTESGSEYEYDEAAQTVKRLKHRDHFYGIGADTEHVGILEPPCLGRRLMGTDFRLLTTPVIGISDTRR